MTIRSRTCEFFNSGTKSKVTVNDVFSKVLNIFLNGKLFVLTMLLFFVFILIQALTDMGLSILSEFTSYVYIFHDTTFHIRTLSEYIVGFLIGSIAVILMSLSVILIIFIVYKFVFVFNIFKNIFKNMFNRIGSIKVLSCDLKEKDK